MTTQNITMHRSRRASEKPIEIFIALFVILAVALVLLKMFQGQISSKTKELKELETERRVEAVMNKAKETCNKICADDATLTAKAKFCMTKLTSDPDNFGLDLNNNEILDDVNDMLIPGVVTCEDSVYCPQITECGSIRSMADCIDILCTAYSRSGLDVDKSNQRLEGVFNPGRCDLTTEEREFHWYYLLEDEATCGSVSRA